MKFRPVSDRVQGGRRWVVLIPAALAMVLLPFAARAQTKDAPKPDADCLACHSQKDLKSESGHSLYVDETKHQAGAHAILNCTDCHTNIKEYPHPARIAKVNSAPPAMRRRPPMCRRACILCWGRRHAIVATGRRMKRCLLRDLLRSSARDAITTR